jgi:hypothetical protein
MALAVAMAASLIIAAVSVWLWTQESPEGGPSKDTIVSENGGGTRPKSRLQKELDANPRWELAKKPAERVQVLDDMALQLESKALSLARARSVKELRSEVELYEDIINRLLKEAPKVPFEDGKRVFTPIARRLAQVQSDAQNLAKLSPDEDVQESLKKLVAVASKGDKQLRGLMV